jgi:hypothetical protein
LIGESGHQLAERYYHDLESKLGVAAIASGLPTNGTVPPETLGEHLDTFAKVIAGGSPDDVIAKVPGGGSPRGREKHSAGIRAHEEMLANLGARERLAEEIIPLVSEEVIEAKAARPPDVPVPVSATSSQQPGLPPADPEALPDWALGWPEILTALGRKNDQSNRDKITRLSELTQGPIQHQGQGAQPIADKAKLLEWWASLADRLAELTARRKDRRASTQDQFNYGSDGTVVPGIDGAIRKRRRKRDA